MQSQWLNIHTMGSRPLERAKNQTLGIGITASLIAWNFFLRVPSWRTPTLLCIASLVTGLTLVVYGCYELPFLGRPSSKVWTRLAAWLNLYFSPLLVFLRFGIFWLLWILFYHLMKGQGIPQSTWFVWSIYIAIPLIGFRKTMCRLYDGSPRRLTQVLLETLRLIGLFAGISLAMSYINAEFFPLQEGTAKISPGYLIMWTPAVLTGLAGTVMYFDFLFHISDRRKR